MTNRTRAKQINIRMTEEEYAAYTARLEKSKLKANEYGRKCLLNQTINVIEHLPELMRQLKSIGNNLNQIARAVNGGYTAAPSVVAELEQEVQELWQLLTHLKNPKTSPR